MKNKIVLTTVIVVFLISLIPLDFAVTQTYPAAAEQELDPNDLEFGLIGDDDLWLKSGSRLYYTQNSGEEWNEITPETDLVEPYLLVSFPATDLGFALYLIQTETSINLEIHKTSSQGKTWIIVDGDLEQKVQQQFSHPFGEIRMQWLDRKNAMVLVKEFTSSNFSVGTLFVTEDGGKHWTTREVPVAEDFIFHEPQLGFMIDPADSQSLYRSLDGGKSWTLIEIDLPEIIDFNDFQVGLPIRLEDETVYLPVKTIEEERQGIDVLVKIEQLATSKSLIEMENPDIIPILPPTGQKQVSTTAKTQISKIEMENAQDLWIGTTGGECQSLPTDEGGVEISCESNWQMLRSQSGGLGWEPVSLPGGLSVVNKSFAPDVQPSQIDPKEVQPQTNTLVRTFIGHAFDKGEIPTLSQLQTWYNSSPYKAVNLYIGGISRYYSNAALSANYLNAMNLQGWQFIPTWVGHQAPCTNYKYPFPYDVNQAYQYGVNNANSARATLIQLGLSNPDGTGSVVYLDLEHFAFTSSCSAAARAYVNGWTTRLSQLGIMSGLYSTATNITDNRFFDLAKPPSVIWIASWYSTPGFRPDETVWDLRWLSNDYWIYHQRILQYSGGHNETWGGVTLNIDCDVAEGRVAVPYGSSSLWFRRWFPMFYKN